MVTDSLEQIRHRVAAAADRSDRDIADITLVAVSKTVGPPEIMEAYSAGHRDFGENRSHELAAKTTSIGTSLAHCSRARQKMSRQSFP